MKKQIAFYLLMGCLLMLVGFLGGHMTCNSASSWASASNFYSLDAYKNADPCIQTVLFIEYQPDRKVEPFSPYRLPVGAHLFGASPNEVVRCAIDMGNILVAYTQSYSLSHSEQQAMARRMLRIVEILCSSDFQNLPPSLSQSRRILLFRMQTLSSPAYEDVQMNITLWCNLR